MARLLLIDDDDTTREVLALLLCADGWEVADAASGQESLSLAPSFLPDVVLSDLRMPGLCGADLAAALRSACDTAPAMLAMTATQLPEAPAGYDALLVKPFAAAAVRQAVSGMLPSLYAAQADTPVLALATFERLKDAMPAAQLYALYEFALEDAERKIRLMEVTSDMDAIRTQAHALKGSCGMIGGERLGALAAAVEADGLPDSSLKAHRIADLRGEISALRRMLEKLFPNARQRDKYTGV